MKLILITLVAVVIGMMVACSSGLSEAELSYNDGVVSTEQGLYAESLQDFDNAIQLDPDFALAYYNRGVSYHYLDQYQNAIADYTKAIQLDPDYALNYLLRSVSHHILGNITQADADKAKGCSFDRSEDRHFCGAD